MISRINQLHLKHTHTHTHSIVCGVALYVGIDISRDHSASETMTDSHQTTPCQNHNINLTVMEP